MARVKADQSEMFDGEKLTFEKLRDKLKGNWDIVANKQLVRHNGSSKEIDLIVVGGKNIFAVEEKSWKGS